jgi:glyceraldehyde 3-phosphate dehydrogenase
MIRLGINGFGRIGRQVLKAVLTRYPESLQVVAVNDLFDVQTNAHLFRYDTNYGRYAGKVGVKKDRFIIMGNRSRASPSAIPRRSPGTAKGSIS